MVFYDLTQKETLSEGDIRTVCKLLEERKPVVVFDTDRYGDTVNKKLTPAHNAKAIKWIRKLHYTKSGKVSKASPFGTNTKQDDVVENIDHFELHDFYDATRPTKYGEVRKFVPLYWAVAKNGDVIEYYFLNGEVNITG